MFERLPPSRKFFFQIFLFIVFIFGVFLFISRSLSNLNTKEYVVYFDRSVSGLKIGNLVYYKGVPVGNVAKIAIDLPNAERVAVLVRINKKLPIYSTFIAKLGMQGLTGHSVIDLENSSKSKNKRLLVGNIPEIKSGYSMIETVFEKVPHLISNANDMVVSISKILSSNEKNLGQSLKNFAIVLSTFNKTMIDLNVGIKSFNNSAIKIEKDVIPNVVIIGEEFSLLLKNVRKDWQTFSNTGLVQLGDLINNVNNVAVGVNDMLQSERSVFGYLLGLS